MRDYPTLHLDTLFYISIVVIHVYLYHLLCWCFINNKNFLSSVLCVFLEYSKYDTLKICGTNITNRPFAYCLNLLTTFLIIFVKLCSFRFSSFWEIDDGLVGLWCLTPLSTIFKLYRGSQFYWWRKPEYPGENHRSATSHWQTLSYHVVSSKYRLGVICTHNLSDDRHWLLR